MASHRISTTFTCSVVRLSPTTKGPLHCTLNWVIGVSPACAPPGAASTNTPLVTANRTADSSAKKAPRRPEKLGSACMCDPYSPEELRTGLSWGLEGELELRVGFGDEGRRRNGLWSKGSANRACQLGDVRAA